MPGLTHDEKVRIVHCLARSFQAYSVILFGSAAQQSLREDSNLDIAYLTDHPPAPDMKQQVIRKLEEQLSREINLVDFNEVPPYLQTQIVSGGMLLYDQKPLVRMYILRKALKNYVLHAQG